MTAGHATRLAVDTNLDPAFIIDLALAANTTVAWRFDFADGSVSWTPGTADLLALSGSPDHEIDARLREAIEPMLPAARAAPPSQDFELEQRFTTRTGGPRWTRFRARTFDTGSSSGLFGVASDVTDQREAEQTAADLTDRYRLLVDLSPDGIVVHQRGRIVYVNPAAVRFAKVDNSSDMVGHSITEFVHPKSLADLMHRIQVLTTPGATSEPSEAILLRRGGETIIVESVSVRTTWRGEDAFQVIMRDVTAQRAAEATLRYQAALITHVSDAIVATDERSRVTSWNPAAEAIYGHSGEDAIGRAVSDLIGAPLDIEEIVRTGGVEQAIHRRSDGTALAVRISAAPMDDGYVLVCADETARRRAERYFATVVASLEEGVLVMTPEGALESANPAALRILDLPEHEIVGGGSPVVNLYDEEGHRIPDREYPLATTRRTGEPQNGRLVRTQRRDGSTLWLSLSCRPLNPDMGPPYSVVASFSDNTERRAIAERLLYEATHDPLTGLANRTVVVRQLSEALERPGRTETIVVLFIDLDKFKVINDSLGHSIGDEVLRVVGRRLGGGIRSGDVVGRLGGDEFGVLCLNMPTPEEARGLATHLRATLTEPIAMDGRQLHIDASMGIVMATPGDSRVAEDLIRDADVAMYQAKTTGRGRYEFFDVALRERMQRRLRLEQELREAVRKDELWVAYQPVVKLPEGTMIGVEALLRWNQPTLGVISPVEFIPLAEESDLINTIGIQTLRATTLEMARQRERTHADLHVAVNLSARQLDDPDLLDTVEQAMESAGLPSSALCLEVTESALMRDPDAAAKKLDSLRQLGITIAIDDFGTGYASLAQLLRLPVDILKIDQSFVRHLGDSTDATSIVSGIIAMAHAVGLTVIAEGVETENQLAVLIRLGCDQAQGYHFGRPGLPADVFALVS